MSEPDNCQKMDRAKTVGGLALKIRQQRKLLRLTQEQLGALAGCGVVFIYMLENGKSTLRLDKLLDVMTALDLQFRLERGSGGIQTGSQGSVRPRMRQSPKGPPEDFLD